MADLSDSGGMSPRGRILSLTVTNFRGFNEPIKFNFDASAVLLRGPNGSGKTSLFDSIQWLLTADLPRLGLYRMRKADLYLTNAFFGNGPASVEATFRIGAEFVSVKRRGDARGSVLEFESPSGRLEGDAAVTELQRVLAPGALPLDEVLHTSGLLQQDDLRQMLQTKPDARYRQLMRLLGLEILDQFERSVRARRNDARDRAKAGAVEVDLLRKERDSVAEQLATAEAQVQRVTEPIALRAVVETTLAQYPRTIELASNHPEELSERQVPADLARLRSTAERTLQSVTGLPRALPPSGQNELIRVDSLIEQAEARALVAKQAVAQAESLRNAVVAATDALGRLTAAALPLLPTDDAASPCPVCLTLIDPNAVRHALEARSANSDAFAQAEASLARATAERDVSEHELSEARTTKSDLLQNEQARANVVRRFEDARRGFEDLETGMLFRARPEGDLPGVTLETTELAYAEAVSTLTAHNEWLTSVRNACDAMNSALSDWSQRLAASRLATERSNAVPRLRETLSLCQTRLDATSHASEQARREATNAVGLHEATKAANEDIFRSRFAALEPLMNDVYSRLDPHPAFKNLSFSIESFRSKGTATATVTDTERNITVNPMLVFSSAQANIVVLSAFLALGWAAGTSSLPFVLLDDPLQAMDDVNVLGFADLARHLRRERQIVIATHEARFAELLERKLSGRQPGEDLIVHDFVGWSRSGPEVETRSIPISELAGLPVLSA
ncbi:AAA family ATPase [Nocardioides terrisoli]|uniref:AAA family ATPase n=1 Tax=Nocardioides terrisoli TaxID=3388267 RepID=UPI00287B7758|nr:AAA family ATPase [Nocardioides marmorisolisilvae]